MQCKCGGSTQTHDVTRNKKLAGQYERCVACGFVHWVWETKGLAGELRSKDHQTELEGLGDI